MISIDRINRTANNFASRLGKRICIKGKRGGNINENNEWRNTSGIKNHRRNIK